jgi:hypothetical protein
VGSGSLPHQLARKGRVMASHMGFARICPDFNALEPAHPAQWRCAETAAAVQAGRSASCSIASRKRSAGDEFGSS